MTGLTFSLPVNEPEHIFAAYWIALKRSVAARNALPPRAALLIFNEQVELINIQTLGGFSLLAEYIYSYVKEGRLRACVVSFDMLEKNTCEGKLISLLFSNTMRPEAKMATWAIINKRLYCEENDVSDVLSYIDYLRNLGFNLRMA